MIEILVLISPFVLLAIILVFVGLVVFILTGEVVDAIGIAVVVGVIGLIRIGILYF